MNAADIAILAVVALSMLVGLWRGFVSGAWSLVSWIAAFWVAWAFGDRVAVFFSRWLDEPAARMLAGYVTCFLGVLIVGALVGWVLHRLLVQSGLRTDDRLLGMVFGLARGVLLVTFAVLVLGFTQVPREASWWRQSRLLPWFENGATWLAARLPAEVSQVLTTGRESFSPLPRRRPSMRPPGAPATPSPSHSSAAGRAGTHTQAHGDVGQ